MNAPMTTFALASRAFAAMMIAGFAAPIAFGVSCAVFITIAMVLMGNGSGLNDFFLLSFIFSIYGTIIFLPAAINTGIFIEIPKCILQIKQNSDKIRKGVTASIFCCSIIVLSSNADFEANSIKYDELDKDFIYKKIIYFGTICVVGSLLFALFINSRFIQHITKIKSKIIAFIIMFSASVTLIYNLPYRFSSPYDGWGSLLIFGAMSVFVGGCSALSWWHLVVKPLRRERGVVTTHETPP
jgi:hypothetical protein